MLLIVYHAGMERKLRQCLTEGRFVGVSDQRSRNMAAIRGRGNKTTERRLRLALVRAGIRGWSLGNEDLPGKPDLCFRAAGVAVFLDGCFWHGCPKCGRYPKTNSRFWRAKIERNRQRDLAASRALRRQGLKVLRFWEHDLRNVERCVARLTKAVGVHTE